MLAKLRRLVRSEPREDAAERRLTRQPELLLVAVLAMLATQDLIELLVLDPGPLGSSLVSLRVLMNLTQAVLCLFVGIVWLQVWQQQSDRLDRETRRAAQLETETAALSERVSDLARRLELLGAEHEEERRLLAYDIHDGLAQVIVSAKQHLDTFEDLWRSGGPDPGPELDKALDRLGRAIVETRLVLAALRPGSLGSPGLGAAVRSLVEDTAQGAGWRVTLDTDLGDAPLPGPVETTAYRIVQEALANALKHARARDVAVTVRREAATLLVEVRDSGAGFRLPAAPGALTGLGILGMQERARLVGGTCQVVSEPAEGTRVVARLPLPNGHA
jgi:signal transduction histidine kinase